MVLNVRWSLDSLKTALDAASIEGEWTGEGTAKHSFRSKKGGILNWWPTTGTIQIQGKEDAKTELQGATNIAGPGDKASTALGATSTARQIFIVHGHDTTARDQLELALHRLGLEPFVLMNTSGEGKTLIEALEGRIGRDYSSDFGIVLMTPDDIGYAMKEGQERAEPRARQNVILETGMLLASLTRKRIAIVVKGHLELPSDLEGIIRFGFNEHVREIIPKLCQRLKEAGFEIQSEQIAAAAQ